jgi:ABC-2 type transport system permease protein
MFKNLYLYRLKTLSRDRILIFWTLLYPIALGTFFGIAFHNIGSGSPFQSIPVAVVQNAAWQDDTAFQQALHGVSADNPEAETKLFQVTPMSREQADESLKNNKIAGFMELDGGQNGAIHVYVRDSGVSQSILHQFVDNYLQARSAFTTILSANPAAAATLAQAHGDYPIVDAVSGNPASNSTLPYFYALIAMAALFGGFWGQREINDTQADQSALGARLGVAPIHKLKALVAGLCATITLHFGALIALLAYLSLVMGIQFNAPLPLLLAACLMGSCMGVTFGAFLSALPIRKEGIKIAVMITVSMVLSFLAGLMVSTIKYAVIHAAPIMAYLNPANVLSDAFYALYAYSDHSRFLFNLGLLAAFSVVFSFVVYLLTRRQKYDSL